MEDGRMNELIDQVRQLTIEVESLKKELRRQENTSPPLRTREPRGRVLFAIGNQVRVLNRFKKPASTGNNNKEWSEAEAKTATVTEVRATQVFFVTNNGIETWRAPNNPKVLE